MSKTVAADFLSPQVIADPFPLFHDLMAHDPVHFNEALGSWCLTRYDDVVAAYRDPRLSSDRVGPALDSQHGVAAAHREALADLLTFWLVFTDPPTHTRLRKLLNQGFTRRAVERLRPRIRELAEELVDRGFAGGSGDVVAEFAYPLPAFVIADILGVPRSDVDHLKCWSDALGQFVFSSRLNVERHAVAADSARQMKAYFGDLIARRRAEPGDAIIDSLIRAHDGDDRLSLDELLSSCALLLFAGHETTTQLLGNGLAALAAHPGERSRLAGLSDRHDLVANAVEEMMRWDGPTLSMTRTVVEDAEYRGRTLRRGDRVFLFNAAANRDPRVFEDPDRFDVGRANAKKQIGFGYGIHLCLGAQLARIEAQCAFPILLRRLSGMTITSDELPWSDSLIIRGLGSLPVTFEAA